MVIPSVIDNRPVTGIGLTFNRCTNLTSISIPNSVTNINDDAFFGCNSLANIMMPGVKSIGTRAFFGCTGLRSLTLPDGLLKIGSLAFSDCLGLKEVTIPGSVTSVGLFAFSGCTGLTAFIVDPLNKFFSSKDGVLFDKNATTLVQLPGETSGGFSIPSGVTNIASTAFAFCGNLTNIAIPASVTTIGDMAFLGCGNLMGFTLDPLNSAYCMLDGALLNKTKSLLVQYPPARVGNYTIPRTVTKIGTAAISGCSGLTAINTDTNVNSLSLSYNSIDGVLWDQYKKKLIAYPGGRIGSYAITNASYEITPYAFSDCRGLTGISIPNGLNRIGSNSFFNCTALTNVALPNDLYVIEESTFAGCTSLTDITLPASTGYIYVHAFTGCTNLTRLLFEGNLPSLSTHKTLLIGGNMVTVYYRNGTTGWGNSFGGFPTAIWYDPDVQDYTYRQNGSTMAITAYTGSGGSATIPDTIFGESVTNVDPSAFLASTNLERLIIPGSIATIGELAFSGCASLKQVYFEGNAPALPGPGGLFDTAANVIVYYRAGATGWGGSFGGQPTAVWYDTDVQDFTYQQNGAAITITGYTGTGGNVTIPDTIFGEPVTSIGDDAFGHGLTLTNITMPESITNIGVAAFKGCTNLASFTAPNKVTTIAMETFAGCSGLTNISFASGVGLIGDRAFSGCVGLANITIPDSVTNIGSFAFADCAQIASVIIPYRVTSLGEGVFSGCSGLTGLYFEASAPTLSGAVAPFLDATNVTVYYRAGTTNWSATFGERPTTLWIDPAGVDFVTLQNGSTITITGYAGPGGAVTIPNALFGRLVNTIGEGAFYGCTNLTNITIPNSITSIGKVAFQYCVNLSNIEIPDSVTKLGLAMFYKCPKLISAKLSNSLKTIELDMFYECTALTSITIPDSVTDIRDFAFYGCSGLKSVNIGNSVSSIGMRVFDQCTSLTNLTIPGSVIRLGHFAFSTCSSLTNINFPDNFPKIDDMAFSFCTGLTNVTLPRSITSIGSWSFGFCSNLVSIVIPASVTVINVEAFTRCTRLTGIYYEGNAPALVGAIEPANTATNMVVYYRAGTTGWGPTFGGRRTALWIDESAYQAWAQSSGLLDKFPEASAETDDADRDGMSNMAEMRAGTDPTTAASVLEFERAPRLADLSDDDKTAIGTDQNALYLQTVPGRSYEIQSVGAMGGAWQTQTNVSATTTQKRILVTKPVGQQFYRTILVP